MGRGWRRRWALLVVGVPRRGGLKEGKDEGQSAVGGICRSRNLKDLALRLMTSRRPDPGAKIYDDPDLVAEERCVIGCDRRDLPRFEAAD